MYFEYAVNPKVIGSSWQNCRYLSEKFGFEKGRLISDFPNDWLGEVRKYYSMIENENDRKRIEIKLKQLKDRGAIVNSNRNYEPDMDWLANAIAQTQPKKCSFKAIISDKKEIELESLLVIEDIDENTPLFKVSDSKKVPASGKEIANEMQLLLSSAKTVLFVDPYFYLRSEHCRETLKMCLKKLNPNELSEINFEIHFKYKAKEGSKSEQSPEDVEKSYETEVKEFLNAALPTGVTLNFYCWSDKDFGEAHHDRYILTNLGGVGVGYGLCAVGKYKKINFRLLSWESNQIELKRFDRNSTELRLIEPVLSIKSGNILERV